MLSLERIQYFRFSSEAVCNESAVKFQQNDTKSDLFFFSSLPDLSGDSLTSQNLKDYFDKDPKTLLVPNLIVSTLLSCNLDSVIFSHPLIKSNDHTLTEVSATTNLSPAGFQEMAVGSFLWPAYEI